MKDYDKNKELSYLQYLDVIIWMGNVIYIDGQCRKSFQ